MEPFSVSVILILVFPRAFELGSVAGLARSELAQHTGLAIGSGSSGSREEPAVRLRPAQRVPFLRIQDSKSLNKTCCLNGGTCVLGSFCACPASFYGRNCEHEVRKKHCGSTPHGDWLPRTCSMCRCWHGQFHCFSQTFLPGCGGHVMGEQLTASGTPEFTASAPVHTVLMLAGTCLAVQRHF
ncbi:teratocarcinoma-derived growth factor 1 [Erinaceus europaeus]|uniref:Teratocarcinoma-derived growth factor 1 n=1 Tax=Erinaceus europaeus TaxID=9365 RepID=A0ABM3YBL0_ERIEU|nr:teratocarcinoma-derived growth factor 1 [Erinaceus europaeus]